MDYNKMFNDFIKNSGYDFSGFTDNNSNNDEKHLPLFLSAMADDFNTPNAFTVMYQLIKDINTCMRVPEKDFKVLQEYLNSLTVMLNILGLIPDVKPLLFNEKELLLKWREARKNKDFALADEIRQKITELGIKF